MEGISRMKKVDNTIKEEEAFERIRNIFEEDSKAFLNILKALKRPLERINQRNAQQSDH
jgi:hypothetical protein